MRHSVDVAIVGLGPVGAVLAALLGKHEVSVVAMDAAPDVFPLPRAAHIDHQALRALQSLGCLDELAAEMIVNPGMRLVTPDEKVLAEIPGNGPNPSNLPASLYFHQPTFDRRLRQACADLPSVEILLGHVCVAVASTGERARVTGRSLAGDDVEIEATYVVGADGASSAVRELLDIDLVDLGFHERWLVVDLLLGDDVPPLPDHALTYANAERPLGFVPMPAPRCRFELKLHDHESSEEMQHPARVSTLLSKWIPPGTAELERAAVYQFHGLLASRWKQGRILLAGDACHQMPPFLGQGMNSGFRDAVNLAWKLVSVIKRGAPDALLDTYEAERRPHVAYIIDEAVRIGRFVCERDPSATAARQRDLGQDPLAFRSLGRFSLPALARGDLVLAGGGGLATQPVLDDGRARFDDLVGDNFLVLARTAAILGAETEWWRSVIGAVVGTPDQFGDFAGQLVGMLDRAECDVLIVRPDRYLLGAGDDLASMTGAVRLLLAAEQPYGRVTDGSIVV